MATKKLQILNSLVSHDTLTNLDAPDQHPIDAVTGLKEALVSKADLVDGKVPAEQLPDDIGGGTTSVTSWNDLEDKPFYETGTKITWDGTPTDTYVQPGQQIEWDGADTGVSLPIPADETNGIPEGITFYKVAEKLDSLEGWTYVPMSLTDNSEGEAYPLTADNIGAVLDDNGDVIATYGTSDAMWVWNVEQVVPVPIMGIELTFPATGLYFINMAGQFRISRMYNAAYDMMEEMKIYKIQEPLNGVLNGYKFNVFSDGEIMEMIINSSSEEFVYGETNTGSSYGAPYIFNILTDNETIDLTNTFGFNITFPKAGLYLVDFYSMGVAFNYLASPDYEIIKIDEKFLPEGIGGDIAGCPIYSGGYLMENDMIVCNYYGLLNSVKEDYSFDMNAGVYDITANNFIMTFMPADDIAESNDYITIKIATGSVGADLNTGYFTSDLEVELQSRQGLESGSWYTIYCLYVERTNKWVGYFTMPKNDVTTLENEVESLESRIDSISSNSLPLKQDKSNLVTDITNRSTNSQYPSAKLLYDTKVALETSITDAVSTKQEISNIKTTLDYASDHTYPSTSLLKDIKTNYDNILQFDTAPTANSEKLLKSGAIATALNKKADTTTLNTQVNNLTTEINKKATQTALDTAVSDLTTEIGKKANSDSVYTKSEIDGLITGVFYYKGSVDTFAELPATAKVGDTYNVKNADAANNVKAGDNVVWCEIDGVGYWDVLSGIVDLSAYETAEEIQDKLDEVQSKLDEKADLSIVNTKADKTDLNNYLTSAEIQIKLEKKADKTEIPSLEGVAMKSDLSKVALSNDYFDLDNKPCYWTGLDLDIIWDGQVSDRYSVDVYTEDNNAWHLTKLADWNDNISLDAYKNSFVSYDSTNTALQYKPSWIQAENYYMLETFTHYPLIILISKNNTSVYISSNSKSVIFEESGIYLGSYVPTYRVSRAIFEKKYFPLDSRYLPVATSSTLGGVKVGDNLSISEDGTISATSLDWDNINNKPEVFTPSEHNHDELYYNKSEIDTSLNTKQEKNLVTSISVNSTDTQYPSAKLLNTVKTNLETLVNTKVDKTEGSRLITDDEGEKLTNLNAPVAISNDYSDLENAPCYLEGVDESFTWDGSREEKVVVSAADDSCVWVKIANIDAFKTIANYRDSFKSCLMSNGNNVSLSYNLSSSSIVYYQRSSIIYFWIVFKDNSSEGSITFPESGIYAYSSNSKTSYVSAIEFEGQFTKLKSGYLPVASSTSIGGVKVGDNLSVSADGTISATSLDWDNIQNKPELYNKNEIDTIKSNLETSINTTKTNLESSITTKVDKVTNSRLMTNAEGTKLSGIEENANKYVLPAATIDSLGGVKVGANLFVAEDGTISTTSLDWDNINNKPELYNQSEIDTFLNTKQDKNLVTTIDENSTDDQYPSAKLLYDIVGNYNTILDEINALIGE